MEDRQDQAPVGAGVTSARGRSTGILLLAVAYGLAGTLGLKLAFVHPSATAVWPPAGIALAALLLGGRRLWPGVFLGALVVNLGVGSFPAAVSIGAGNTLGAVFGCWLVERFAHGRNAFSQARDVFRFAALAVILGTAVSASAGALSLCVFEDAPWSGFWPIWLTWWLGDSGGTLIVAPLLVLWGDRRLRLEPGRVHEAALLALSLTIVGVLVFLGGARDYPLEFLCIPPLLWAGFRFGPREAASATFLLSALAVAGTLLGHGPFTHPSPNESLLLLQAYLGITSMTALAVAALVKERSRVEQALRRVVAIVESSDDAIIGKTLDGTIASWNRGAEAIFGYPAGEAIGRPIALLAPADRAIEDLEIMQRLQRGEHVDHFETQRVRKDGSVIEVSLTVSPIRDPFGRLVGASTIARDVSSARRLEEEQHRVRQLAEENRAVLETSRLKTEFVSNVSHELRTPLHALTGFADLLFEGRVGQLTTEQKQCVAEVLTNSQHLLKLIDDVLDLAKVEAGRFDFQPEPLDLAAAVGEVAAAIGPLAARKRITLDTAVSAEIGPVALDPARFRQVLYNYVSNALKFTPEGGRIRIRLRPEGADWFRVEVEDTGIGIRGEDIPRLFVAFEQLGAAGGGQRGTGLGLAFTKQLVEAQGGRVGVTSIPGSGSVFFAMLPRATAATP